MYLCYSWDMRLRTLRAGQEGSKILSLRIVETGQPVVDVAWWAACSIAYLSLDGTLGCRSTKTPDTDLFCEPGPHFCPGACLAPMNGSVGGVFVVEPISPSSCPQEPQADISVRSSSELAEARENAWRLWRVAEQAPEARLADLVIKADWHGALGLAKALGLDLDAVRKCANAFLDGNPAINVAVYSEVLPCFAQNSCLQMML